MLIGDFELSEKTVAFNMFDEHKIDLTGICFLFSLITEGVIRPIIPKMGVWVWANIVSIQTSPKLHVA
jgi:hypothetical protein